MGVRISTDTHRVMSAETMGSPDKAPPARHVLPYEAIEKSRWRHTPQAHEDAIAAAREKRRLAEAQVRAKDVCCKR